MEKLTNPVVNDAVLKVAASMEKLTNPYPMIDMKEISANLGEMMAVPVTGPLVDFPDEFYEGIDTISAYDSEDELATNLDRSGSYNVDSSVNWTYVNWFNLCFEMAPLVYQRILESTGADELNRRGRNIVMNLCAVALFFELTGNTALALSATAFTLTVANNLVSKDEMKKG
ncbi:hypothetical protein HZS54_18000 [Halosimplex pelagicum]|uniref:Uncharacterized protein n=2 Tax=Halosimplex pelagicum TaxID=869886 RepID=A0A7D5TD14_9EURY|nr:hypothetical protein HZS54_18000 [Halosimplex pelagicum]